MPTRCLRALCLPYCLHRADAGGHRTEDCDNLTLFLVSTLPPWSSTNFTMSRSPRDAAHISGESSPCGATSRREVRREHWPPHHSCRLASRRQASLGPADGNVAFAAHTLLDVIAALPPAAQSSGKPHRVDSVVNTGTVVHHQSHDVNAARCDGIHHSCGASLRGFMHSSRRAVRALSMLQAAPRTAPLVSVP